MTSPIKDISSLPRPKSHWLFKHAMAIKKQGMLKFIHENREKHGDIFYVDAHVERLVIITRPDLVKYVLQENQRNYEKSFGYRIMEMFLGKGLLTNEGEDWIKQRRLIQPAFHREKIAALTEVMIEESEVLAKEWRSKFKPGQVFELTEEMMRVTLKIVAKAMFGSNVDEYIDDVSEAVSFMNEFAIDRILNPIRLPAWMPLPKHLAFRKASKQLDDTIYGIINARRKDSKQHHDLLAMLMDARDEDTGEGMSDLQLRDECMTIFLAGHETTANALNWTFYLLSQHPEIIEKFHAELKTVLDGRSPTISDLRMLPYTKAIIEESMRLYPPAWVIGRKSIAEDVLDGVRIPANTNILMSAYEIHRHPSLWKDPNDFKPERFLEGGEASKQDRYAYFPFGGGPRLCIGNSFANTEILILMAILGQEFSPKLDPTQIIEPDPLITLRPKYGMRMFL